MNKTVKLLFIVSFLILTVSAVPIRTSATPAMRGSFIRTQPDGSTFTVCLRGDEFTRLAFTSDGRPVIKDTDGWYCYADISADGIRRSSGVRVSSSFAHIQKAVGQDFSITPDAALIRAVNAAAAPKKALMKHNAATRHITTRAGKEERAIIILAQFKDLKFTYKKKDFEDLVHKKGYNAYGSTGSIMDYFNAQFGDGISLTLDIGPVVTLSHDHAYYGENDADGSDKLAYEAVIEACTLSDPEVDFSLYDLDGDGEVDNIFVFFAGPDEAEGAGEEFMWSHSWYIFDGAGKKVRLDGKLLNRYALSTEISYYPSLMKQGLAPIGAFCHEFCHTLGLMDMYDTDAEDSGGTSKALWDSTSLMDYGCYNNEGRTPPNLNALELYILGLGECRELTAGSFALPNLGKEKVFYRLDSDYPYEYWLFECRKAEGWDKYIGGNGLLIYHIDFSDRPTGWSDTYSKELTALERFYYNELNCRPDHQCVRLISSNPSATKIDGVFWPYRDHTEFSAKTDPPFVSWSGASSDYTLTNIKYTDGEARFIVRSPLSNIDAEIFQDAAILSWSSDYSPTEACILTIRDKNGKKLVTAEVSPHENGLYAYRALGLEEKSTYVAKVQIKNNSQKSVSFEFTTKSFYKSSYPFIYLESAERESDGRFVRGSRIPMIVYNAIDAAQTRWFFDGKPVNAGEDGYFTLSQDGELKAVIDYKNGSQEIIYKTITIK